MMQLSAGGRVLLSPIAARAAYLDLVSYNTDVPVLRVLMIADG
jgi:hypothetical protein